MKQVDIIISSGINHIGGPLGTLKRILSKKDYFESRGYKVSVFTFDSVLRGPYEDILIGSEYSADYDSRGYLTAFELI